MPKLIEYLGEEQLAIGLVVEQEKKKISITDERGRPAKVLPDKVLFSHSAASIDALQQKLTALAEEVDVALLWETLQDEDRSSALDAAELASLYFDDQGDAYGSAVFRALSQERVHFRRKGKTFEPRSADDLQQLQEQLAAEARSAEEIDQLELTLKRCRKARQLEEGLAQRLERLLRGAEDRELTQALARLSGNPQAEAFNLLLAAKHLSPTASLAVLQADIGERHAEAVRAHAEQLEPPTAVQVKASAFSIDDPDTLEVDDALSVSEEDGLLRVDIDIADAAAFVRAGDPVDREALRRAATLYLPTGPIYMLPGRIGRELGSLQEGRERPALRTSVWLDSSGQVQRQQLERTFIRVAERLDYDTADELLAQGETPTAHCLRLLSDLAVKRTALRKAAGSMSFQRPEWKIFVSEDGAEIGVKRLVMDSPSRALVAEMMILTNSIAAQEAQTRGIPLIYRVQPAPTEKLPEVDPRDPAIFVKMRGLLKPATLSLQPEAHWGLGLSAYTQISSPLRRYADLVMQRQLCANLAGEAPPHDAQELYKVLAAAEATERENRRLEATVTIRWAMEYVQRMEQKQGLEGIVQAEAAGGYRVELSVCGVHGILVDKKRYQPGEKILVDVTSVKPRKRQLRLKPAGR